MERLDPAKSLIVLPVIKFFCCLVFLVVEEVLEEGRGGCAWHRDSRRSNVHP